MLERSFMTLWPWLTVKSFSVHISCCGLTESINTHNKELLPGAAAWSNLSSFTLVHAPYQECYIMYLFLLSSLLWNQVVLKKLDEVIIREPLSSFTISIMHHFYLRGHKSSSSELVREVYKKVVCWLIDNTKNLILSGWLM